MRILDPTCSVKGMWFDKNNPDVIYGDIRSEDIDINGDILSISPDAIMDFTFLPFPDGCFDMVVFDPPHLKNLKNTAFMAKKYGMLFPDWRATIKGGFEECFRVLRSEGTLIFKWSTGTTKSRYIPLKDVLELTPQPPILGHKTGNNNQTRWITFVKFNGKQ